MAQMYHKNLQNIFILSLYGLYVHAQTFTIPSQPLGNTWAYLNPSIIGTNSGGTTRLRFDQVSPPEGVFTTTDTIARTVLVSGNHYIESNSFFTLDCTTRPSDGIYTCADAFVEEITVNGETTQTTSTNPITFDATTVVVARGNIASTASFPTSGISGGNNGSTKGASGGSSSPTPSASGGGNSSNTIGASGGGLSSSSQQSHTSTMAFAIFGCILSIAVILGILYFLLKRRFRRFRRQTSNQYPPDPSDSASTNEEKSRTSLETPTPPASKSNLNSNENSNISSLPSPVLVPPPPERDEGFLDEVRRVVREEMEARQVQAQVQAGGPVSELPPPYELDGSSP